MADAHYNIFGFEPILFTRGIIGDLGRFLRRHRSKSQVTVGVAICDRLLLWGRGRVLQKVLWGVPLVRQGLVHVLHHFGSFFRNLVALIYIVGFFLNRQILGPELLQKLHLLLRHLILLADLLENVENAEDSVV